MAHLTTRGDPCCYKDGHTHQHRTKRDDAYDERYNRTRGRDNSARYRNRNPVKRALTVVQYNAKVRGAA